MKLDITTAILNKPPITNKLPVDKRIPRTIATIANANVAIFTHLHTNLKHIPF